jgi:hypothetical protein
LYRQTGPCINGTANSESAAAINFFISYWFGVVLYFILCLVGIAGNLVSVLVFSDRSMANTFNTYLKLLAYVNFSYVFFCFVEALIDLTNSAQFVGFGGLANTSPVWHMLNPYLIHPMRESWWMASIYMTVAISADR